MQRACLEYMFGVPPLGGSSLRQHFPPEGGTPNIVRAIEIRSKQLTSDPLTMITDSEAHVSNTSDALKVGGVKVRRQQRPSGGLDAHLNIIHLMNSAIQFFDVMHRTCYFMHLCKCYAKKLHNRRHGKGNKTAEAFELN